MLLLQLLLQSRASKWLTRHSAGHIDRQPYRLETSNLHRFAVLEASVEWHEGVVCVIHSYRAPFGEWLCVARYSSQPVRSTKGEAPGIARGAVIKRKKVTLLNQHLQESH